MTETVTIYTDGAARGNPGPSASGYIACQHGKAIAKRFVYNDVATNNYAEYRAILLALEWCAGNLDLQHSEVVLYSDSELVVRQINGEYKVKAEKLIQMNNEIKALEQKFSHLAFRNARREHEGIAAVDKQLNALLDRMEKAGKA